MKKPTPPVETPAPPEAQVDRVEEVARLRLDGLQAGDLLSYAAEKQWAIDEAGALDLIRQADELIHRRRTRRYSRSLAIARREQLLARAINGGDLPTALRILESLDRARAQADQARENAELRKLATAQHQRIRELETRLATPALTLETTHAQERQTAQRQTDVEGPGEE